MVRPLGAGAAGTGVLDGAEAMGLIDSIKGALGGSLGQAAVSALPEVIERVFPGGLVGLVNGLQRSGYGRQVNSWLGRDANQDITAEDLRKVIAPEQVRQIAERLGIPPEQALAVLAKLLPETVDGRSPEGTIRPPAAT